MELKEIYEKKEIHEKWESVYRSNTIQNSFNDKMMQRVIAYLNPPIDALFLDAGCGTGSHSIRIAQSGYRCIAVDISAHILNKAKANILKCGLDSRVSFLCQPLENLEFGDEVFDIVYCRGVLMHIPDWERALYNLCRVLKFGGKIVIMESNHNSLEAHIVRIFRRWKKTNSTMVRSDDGIEFWSMINGNPFVVRTANISRLVSQLKRNGVCMIKRFSTEMWDINRFPSGIMRNIIIRFNQVWFLLGLPAFLSSGNGIIGEKSD